MQTMPIAKTILERQDIKEMTRRSIKILIARGARGEDVDDLVEEFELTYGERV